jgi:hypothetical protein
VPQAQPGPGVQASVAGGTLQITQDAGVGGLLFVLYSPQSYTIQLETRAAVRAGPGCQAVGPSVTACAAAPVQRLRVDAGDGDDRPQLGGGVITGSPGIPVPVSVSLGPGDDAPAFKLAAQPVEVDGGTGDDRVELGTVRDDAGDGVSSATVALGAGDDSVIAGQVAGAVAVKGGSGRDVLRASGGGALKLDGGRGRDTLSLSDHKGRATLIGGVGDDLFSGDDEDAPTGITTVRAGAGDDTVVVGPDHDRDVIDCDCGRDTLRSPLEGGLPPTDNTYIGCPPVGIRIAGRGRHAGGGTLVVRARRAAPATVRVVSAVGRRVLAPQRRVRLHRGRNLVPLRARRLPAGKEVRVELTAVARSGDRAKLVRLVKFTA